MGLQSTLRRRISDLATGSYTSRTHSTSQILLFVPVAPFNRCFSAVYRVLCPCCRSKGDGSDDDRRRQSDDKSKHRESTKAAGPGDDKHDGEGHDDDAEDDSPPAKYSTISQLTNATMVMPPPTTFAKFMLRKSVDRLNSEVSSTIFVHSAHDFSRSVSRDQSISIATGGNQRQAARGSERESAK